MKSRRRDPAVARRRGDDDDDDDARPRTTKSKPPVPRKRTTRSSLLSALAACGALLVCRAVAPLLSPRAVRASSGRSAGGPNTVRPLPSRRRLPFLPSRKNPRGSAKEAYLAHLRTELDSAQKRLYVSQNTCATLRRRWEEQRRETLELMASRASYEASRVNENAEVAKEKEERIQRQGEEIERLHELFRTETKKYQEQMAKLSLLSDELRELQAWKEERKEKDRSDEGKLSEYDRKLQESEQKRIGYKEKVELLALKLEAAEFAAKQNQRGGEAGGSTAWERRSRELRSELEGVRAKYSKLIANSRQTGEGERQHVEEEMDQAIQSVVESALGAVEREWEERYETLEGELSNVTEWATSLEAERDAALGRAEEASESSIQTERREGEESELSEEQRARLREELTAELTAELTGSLADELTEKLTTQLTETLSKKIEKRYKKKYKRLRNELRELKEQQETSLSEETRSREDAARQQEQLEQRLEAEAKRAKEEIEREYRSKLEELQREREEEAEVQKERMRKLVRALLEREAGQKRGRAASSSREKTKRKEGTSGGRRRGDGGEGRRIDDRRIVLVEE